MLKIQPQPKFGYHVGFDMGSANGPTGKAAIYRDDWTKVSESQGSTSLTREPVPNPDNLFKRISQFIRQNVHAVASKLTGVDQLGKTVVMFVPGQPLHGLVSQCTHIKMPNGKPIRNLDFNRVKGMLKDDLKTLPLDEKVRFIIANDMLGGTAAALGQLAQKRPEHFKPGLDAIYIMSGGGQGVAFADYVGGHSSPDFVRVKLTEFGDIPYAQGGRRMDKAGSRLPALLGNFATHLPDRYNDTQRKAIEASKNGRIATTFEAAKQALPDLSPTEYKTAALAAVNGYINGISLMAATNIYKGTNLAIVAGQLSDGIKTFVQSHADWFAEDMQKYQQIPAAISDPARRHTPFEKVFLSRTFHQLRPGGKDQALDHAFDVVSDLKIIDNTEGTPYVAQGRFDGRSDRYIIPADILKTGIR